MKLPASFKALKFVAQGTSFATAKQLVKDRRLAKSLAIKGLDKQVFDKAEARAKIADFKPKTGNQFILQNDALYFFDHPEKLAEVWAKHQNPQAAAKAAAPQPNPKAVRFAAEPEVVKAKTPPKVRFDDDVPSCKDIFRGGLAFNGDLKVSVKELTAKLAKVNGKKPDR